MPPTPQRSGVIAFGSFQFHPDTGVLKRHGVRLRLARQPARILGILAQQPGELVRREELREQIWGADTFVDFEHGLNAAINKLRQALGDSAEHPRYIETLPGQGYRFVAATRSEEIRDPPTDLIADPAPSQAKPASWREYISRFAFAGVLILTMVNAGIAWLFWLRTTPGTSRPTPSKFIIPAPEGVAFQPSGARTSFNISPDGSRLAFTTLNDDGELRLWIRALRDLEPVEMQSARGLTTMFWSPHGESLYIGADRSLRRFTPKAEASWQIISDLPRRVPSGATWLSPNRILLSNRQLTAIVPSAGGKSEIVRQTYLWPQVLPDGKNLLYLAYDQQLARFRLQVGPYGNPEYAKSLLETDSRVVWVASTETPGASYLLYVRAGSLLAQAFNLSTLRLTGEPVALASDIHVFQPTGAADFSVSENGVLIYQPLSRRSRIVWVDRSGRELEQVGPDGLTTTYVRASVDGRKVAASVHNPQKTSNEIWVYDTQSKVARVVAPGPGLMDKAVWSPDGSRLICGAAVGSGPRLRGRSLLEPSQEERLPEADFQLPTDWSRDGRFILFQSENTIDGDIGVVDLKTTKLTWLLKTPSHESNAVFSPDGKSIAFLSNDSGRLEAYVQRFTAGGTPGLSGDRLRVSGQGAQLIRWRGDGKEICYLGLDGILYSVPLGRIEKFGAPRPLFRIPVTARAVLPAAFGFDVSSDGSRFLVPLVREPLNSHLVVFQNWESILRQH